LHLGKKELLRLGWLRNRRADLHPMRRLRAGRCSAEFNT
jgi:hypothetical protein